MDERRDQTYLRILVVRCRLGDRIAFEELVARCQPELRGFLYRMLLDHHAADDLAQEVWLDVFRGISSLNDTEAFMPWLYRVAHRRLCRRWRRRPEPVCPLDERDFDPAATEPIEFSAEEARELHRAIDQLSAEHREVVLLRFMKEMSYQEISQVLNCPVGTVRSRLHHARAALRSLLEKVRKS